MELYKSLYSAEMERNFETIDNKIVGFRERLRNIKSRMNAKNYDRSDEVPKERKMDKLKHIAEVQNNLNELYNFNCLLISEEEL